MEIVDPVVEVVWIGIIAEVARLWGPSGQSIGTVDLSGNVSKLKVEC